MGMGMNAARSLRKSRKKQKKKKNRRNPPFKLGKPQTRGLVIDRREIECKQPNSGKRKCARVKLVGTGDEVTVFMPGDHAKDVIEEHDEVIIEGIGGAKGKSMGDLPGVRFKVVKVQDVSLEAILSGKIQKPVRR